MKCRSLNSLSVDHPMTNVCNAGGHAAAVPCLMRRFCSDIRHSTMPPTLSYDASSRSSNSIPRPCAPRRCDSLHVKGRRSRRIQCRRAVLDPVFCQRTANYSRRHLASKGNDVQPVLCPKDNESIPLEPPPEGGT